MRRGSSAGPDRRGPHLALAAAIVAAALPAVVQAVRLVRSGWVPVGDDAAIALLARDVLSRASPLHGMPSMLPTGAASGVHHPGPLLFWLLALPVRLSGGAPGSVAVTVAAVQVAALACIGVLASRRAGIGGAVAALALATAAEVALGRDVLGSPLNSYVVLLPFGAFLVAAWSVASGDGAALLPAAFFGSLAAQSYLLYLPVVGMVAVLALVGYTLVVRGDAPARRRGRERVALAVFAVCWSPVVYDTAVHFPGNFPRLLGEAGASHGEALGLRGVWAVIRIVGQVPFWLAARGGRRWSLYEPLRWWEALLALAVAAVLIAALRARGRDALPVAGVTAIVLLLTGWTLSRLPLLTVAFFGSRDLFVFVVGAGFTGVVTAAVLTLLRTRAGPRSRRPAIAAGAAAVALVVLAGVGVARRSPDDVFLRGTTSPATSAAVRELSEGGASLDRDGVYVMAPAAAIYTPEELGVFWELSRDGYDVRARASDPYLGEQYAAPEDATGVLHLVPRAAGSPGWEELAATARTGATDGGALRNFRRLLAQLRLPPEALTERARRRLADPGTGGAERALLAAIAAGDATGLDLASSGRLASLLDAGALDPAAEAYGYLVGYRELERAGGRSSLALYLAPAG